MTGSLCNTIVMLPKHYDAEQSIVAKLQSFVFSEHITWYHCPTCGTQVMARAIDEGVAGHRWILASGTLEQAEGVFELDGHEWIGDTLDGGFSDFLQHCHGEQLDRYAGHFGKDEKLPLYWQSQSRPDVEPKADDKLHAHCKCNGVEFWIARPSARSALGNAPWPDLIIPYHTKPPPPPKGTAWWLRVKGTKFLAGNCSCNSCRLATGMEWINWTFVPTIDITLDSTGEVPFRRDFGTLKHYRSSDEVTRHFCGTCE
jgi:hypothetical protein